MRAAIKVGLAVVLAAGAMLVALSSVAAAAEPTPSPAWRLRLVALPTNLAPGSSGSINFGPVYAMVATNVGGAAAVGPVTLSASFPAEVTPIFDATAPRGKDRDQSSPDPVCSKAPGQTVTCTAEGPVHPSRPLVITIPVEVSGALVAGDVLPDVEASVASPGATTVSTSIPTRIDTVPPPFGFLPGAQGLSTLFTGVDGSAAISAGSHPDQMTVNLGFPVEQPEVEGPTTGAGHARDIVTDLPQGVVVNLQAAAKCTEVQLLAGEKDISECPAASQVGMVLLTTDTLGPKPELSPIYNMEAPPGSPGMVAFNAANVGIYVHVTGGVRSESDFGIYTESPDTLARDVSPLEDIQIQLWGNPGAESHDQVRDPCRTIPSLAPCAGEPRDTPLLTMPSACTSTLISRARVRSWEEAGEGVEELGHEVTAPSTDLTGNPVGVGACSVLEFDPTLTLRPDTSTAESPAGVEIDLRVPQSEGAAKATSNLKDATVTLPPGLVANAAAAGRPAGLQPGADRHAHRRRGAPGSPLGQAAELSGRIQARHPGGDDSGAGPSAPGRRLPGSALPEPIRHPACRLLGDRQPAGRAGCQGGEQDRSRSRHRPGSPPRSRKRPSFPSARSRSTSSAGRELLCARPRPVAPTPPRRRWCPGLAANRLRKAIPSPSTVGPTAPPVPPAKGTCPIRPLSKRAPRPRSRAPTHPSSPGSAATTESSN